MRAFIFAHPPVDLKEIDVLYSIDLVVFADDLEERVLHFSGKVIPDDYKAFVQQPVFDEQILRRY